MRGKKFLQVLVQSLVAAVFLGTLLAGAALADFRFVFLADSRGGSKRVPLNTTALQALVDNILHLTPAPAFIVFGGDLCYRANPDQWEKWDRILAPLAAKMPLYVVTGNHELYQDVSGKPGTLLANQVKFQGHCQKNYSNPGDTHPPRHPNYKYLAFSFPFGQGEDKSLFIALDSFYMWQGKSGEDKILYGGITDTQLAWVEDLLKTAADQGYQHKFIMTHAPVYPTKSGAKQDRGSMLALAKLMDKYQVDIFLAGHEHLYDRLLIDKKVDPAFKNTVLQLISGCAGAPFVGASIAPFGRKTICKKNEYVVVDVKGGNLEFKAIGGTKAQGYREIDSCKRLQGHGWTCP